MTHANRLREWYKSSYSDGATNCVETLLAPESTRVRDTQHRAAGHLEFPRAEWLAFLAGLRTTK